MSFVQELKRRNVFRVGIAYLIAAWLIAQATELALDSFGAPGWVIKTVLLLLVAGFPIALLFAWAFELTPEGLKREKDVDRAESITPTTGRKIDFLVIAALALALVFVVVDQYVFEEQVDSADQELSIAVLPFRNRSAIAEDAYFVDGIHDDILTQLARLSVFDTVISRTSVEQYRDTTKTMPQIGQELGVTAILEGGVQRAGNKVRINVQLIDAGSDEHLWADSYEEELTIDNLFAIQRRISMGIASQLQATLTANDERELSRLPTENLEAYDAYLLGKKVMADRTLEDLRAAKSYFEQAVALDQGFALAHVGIADSTNLLVAFFGFDNLEQRRELLSNAESAARNVLAIDDRLGEAYAALGYNDWLRGENTSGATNFHLAIEYAPNYAPAYRWYAQVLWQLGREAEALDTMLRGVALDPLSRVTNAILADAYDIVGQTDKALATYDRVLAIDPKFQFGINQKAWFHFDHGDFVSAIALWRQELDIYPTTSLIPGFISWAYSHLNANEERDYWGSLAARVSNELQRKYARLFEHIEQGRKDEAADLALEILRIGPACLDCWNLIVDRSIDAGNPAAVLDLIREHYPDLLDSSGQGVVRRNVIAVPWAIWALRHSERFAEAETLAASALDLVNRSPRVAVRGFGVRIADVKILTVLGKYQDALNALREAIDSGWRTEYNAELGDPLLDPIRDAPEFVAAREQVDADMASQLARIRKMEANGELPLLPE